MTAEKQKYFHPVNYITHNIITKLSGFFLIFGIMAAHSTMGADMEESEFPVEKNQIVICIPEVLASLDPTNHRSRITQIVLKNIFDSLTTRDENNVVIPQLAESWRLMDDTLWHFNLRKGVRFHNNHLLTAADVKFTLDRVIHEGAMDGRTSPRKDLFDPISEVFVVNDHTVCIKTAYPWPNLPLMLSLQEIMPINHMQAADSREMKDHPVGTGPFRFVKKGKNEIILERFKDYYGGSPSRPPVRTAPLGRVVFKVVPSYLDQVAMIKTGKCDIIFNIPPQSIPILEMSPGILILKNPSTKSYFGEINCTRPPFDDVRVRRALNYAVDIDEIITHKLQGRGSALSTVLLPNAFGYDPQLRPYPYNPSIARELLDSAAYPEDRPILIYSTLDNLSFADSIAFYLTRLGLKTRMITAKESRPRIIGPDATWDIFVGSWGNSTLDPMGILRPKLNTRGYGNFSGFASNVLDYLLLRAQQTMDESMRADYYHQIQTIIFSEAPMIFGYAPDEYYAITERVKNFRPSPSGMIEMHDIYVNGEG